LKMSNSNVLSTQKPNLQIINVSAEEKSRQHSPEKPQLAAQCREKTDPAQKVAENVETDSLITTTNWNQICKSFDDMDLQDELLRGIYANAFEKPSRIQERAIVPVVKGRDTIAQAQSGTGKTATFSIACLERVNKEVDTCQALILAPTRELAQQIFRVVSDLGMYMEGIRIHACVGGSAVRNDIMKLKEGMHIIVGTPGRVYDMICRNALKLEGLRMFVLDEADEMLSRGFKDQIYDIFQYLPKEVQVGLFSATFDTEILKMTQQFMRDPVRILVKKEQLTLEGIRQFYVDVDERWKLDTLCDLYESLTINQCIIYCNRRHRVEWLAEQMGNKDFTVSAMHGQMDAEKRRLIMLEFRTGSSRVLITTDLLARGIDVAQVSLVINYDLPMHRENYIHRIGRGGRFGKKGVAINFVSPADVQKLRELEQFYATQVEELPCDLAGLGGY